MRGPTCIVWANLTPFSLQLLDRESVEVIGGAAPAASRAERVSLRRRRSSFRAAETATVLTRWPD